MKKFIDGIAVVLTPQEEQAFLVQQSTSPAQVVPQRVSRAQFLLALLDLGLLDAVEAVIAGADRTTQINYRERLEFERSHPLIATMATVLNKTDPEIDAVFILAATK